MAQLVFTTEAQRTRRFLRVALRSTFFWVVLFAGPIGFVLSDAIPPLSASEIVAIKVANWITYPVGLLLRPLAAASWFPLILLIPAFFVAQFVWAVFVANLFALIFYKKKSL